MPNRSALTRFAKVHAAIFLFALLAIGSKRAFAEDHASQKQLWLYYPTNLLVNENVDRLETIFRRAAKAGFSHVLIGDSKFSNLDRMPREYFRNVDRVKRIAGELHLELVPAVFPIGWSNALLFHDPNLAEGLPVRDQLFVVHNGEARVVADPPVAFPQGNLSDLKRWSWKDNLVTEDDGAARMKELKGRVGRVVQSLKVSPFRQYRISVQIKTKDFQGTPEIKVLANDRDLNYNDLGVKPTQDWTTHWTVFNSLDNHAVNVYFGCWNGGGGSVWFKDAHLEEVGLLNVLRRPGAPLTVRHDDSSVGGSATPGAALVEGTDFERVVDPHLGNNPYPGEYDLYHAPPTIHAKLPDGTRLRVSYYHPMIIYGGSVMIALSEPKTMELLRDQARRMHAAFGAKAYFMEHDEIRIFNWDAASERRHLDAGPLLAANVKACTQILHDVNPGGEVYAWSDMFDPHHNAVKNYYLVNGSLIGSWKGLDPSVHVADWNFGHRDESLKFFADRGHSLLIAGYYDAPLSDLRAWLDSAAKVPSANAVMYTTWQNNYGELENFAAAVKAHPWWKQGGGQR
ncbi:MAG TPA: hypothetical protein VHX65_11735 [Pirellulales bacterium]|jgi:hypothetical protein|nr:hypothetical protein [Pirellulales bacterium]